MCNQSRESRTGWYGDENCRTPGNARTIANSEGRRAEKPGAEFTRHQGFFKKIES